LQYPKVLFNVDLSGIRLTIGQAAKVKKLRSGRAFPDMVVYESTKNWHGLFMELKSKSPYQKNGKLYSNNHLREQQIMIFNLKVKQMDKLNSLCYNVETLMKGGLKKNGKNI